MSQSFYKLLNQQTSLYFIGKKVGNNTDGIIVIITVIFWVLGFLRSRQVLYPWAASPTK